MRGGHLGRDVAHAHQQRQQRKPAAGRGKRQGDHYRHHRLGAGNQCAYQHGQPQQQIRRHGQPGEQLGQLIEHARVGEQLLEYHDDDGVDDELGLKRAAEHGLELLPGESVDEYVGQDDAHHNHIDGQGQHQNQRHRQQDAPQAAQQRDSSRTARGFCSPAFRPAAYLAHIEQVSQVKQHQHHGQHGRQEGQRLLP